MWVERHALYRHQCFKQPCCDWHWWLKEALRNRPVCLLLFQLADFYVTDRCYGAT